MTKVGVLGARGRMGREVIRTVSEAPDLHVVAEVDQGDDRDALTGCDVVVDFTHPGVVMDNLRWCVENGLDVVVGTSGFGEDRLDEVQGWLDAARGRARPGRAELLRRRHLDDALRRAGGALLPLRRGHRAAPRGQGGRTVRHGAAHRVDDRRGPGRGRPRPAAGRHRVGAARRARRHRGRRPRALGTRRGADGASGGAVRRPGGDAHDQARLPGPGSRSCRVSCWPSAASPPFPRASPWAWRACSAWSDPGPGHGLRSKACAAASRLSARPSPSR